MSSLPIWRRLGYTTQNQYRNAKAREQGYSSYRQQRDAKAKAAGKQRDYAAERERRNRLSQTRGFTGSSNEQSTKRNVAKWGLTWDQFLTMRELNRKYWADLKRRRQQTPAGFPIGYHKYVEHDNRTPAEQVGYVVSYYHAIVDEKHNWHSTLDENGQWKMVSAETSEGLAIVPKADKWWRLYLVKYAKLRNEDYYDLRYGRQ